MLFSFDDPALIYNKLVSSELLARASTLPITNKARVKAKWNDRVETIRHWSQIPLVVERLNFRVTGNRKETFKDWVCKSLFADGANRQALSLGCGDGERELDWAKRGVFSKLVGLDLSPDRVMRANRAASQASLSAVLDFQVADVNQLRISNRQFDVVIFEHSLHHFTNIGVVLDQVRGILSPNGLLVVDEFIGPRRFQWPAHQLAFADAILRTLPAHLRQYYFGHGIKSKNLRAGELLMWLNDPSEAVESDKIEHALAQAFAVTHRFDYGGTISHLVFHDIAHNFVECNPEADRWANWVLDAEEQLMQIGLIQSDFACFVCRI